jgi:Tfp pilus assembly protein PilF
MKKLFLTSALALTFSTGVIADQYLIEEMESLKSTLDKSDPDRAELSLRLADLYFDVSIQEGAGSIIVENRRKAEKLYKDVLLGRDGVPKASPQKANVIKFQLARVLGKLSSHDEAKKYYQDVFDSNLSTKKLKREAAFSMAEYYEEKVNFNLADKYYQEALALCENLESKNYGHYKRAWLHYKEVKLDTAIEELKLSLFERDGSVREKVINDLLLFFSNQTTNGEPELAYIRELIVKTGQKGLVRRLVESFYGAGNRIAGSTVLVHLNNDKPDPFYEMRLLEEFYGFGDVDLVKDYLGRIEKRSAKDIPSTKEEKKEFKAMLKRVIVQFDSEAQSNQNYPEILRRSIEQYLVFYPNDDMRKKMQQGWLKVQTNQEIKVAQLGIWIKEDILNGFSDDDLRKLRQTRLSFAQKLKKSDIVIEESLAIAKILNNSEMKKEEAREFTYVAAREHFKAKRFSEALTLFLPLTDISKRESIDKWAMQSQHLVLDIFNTRKDFPRIMAQADLWLNSEAFTTNKSLKKDFSEIALVRKQASFEAVAVMGESVLALDKFYGFCFSKVFEEKSCANAKILAVKLKDQKKLVSLLEKSKDEKALMTEYEFMGRFSDAAKLQEKFNLTRSSDIPDFLKISLLYEIDGNLSNRDRVLKKMISKIRKDRKIDAKFETAIYKTLEEANLLNNRTLLLPWTLDRKISLANRLSIESPNKANLKILKAQSEYAGSTWSKFVLNKVQKSFTRQGKVNFYGRRSKTLFKRRVSRLESFATMAKPYLEGSDAQTRIYILDMLKLAYQNLGAAILNTPLPEGLTEDILMQVQGNLTQMATPYITVGSDYERLQTEEMNKLEPIIRDEYTAQLEVEKIQYKELIKNTVYEINLSGDFDFKTVEVAKNKLASNPFDKLALEEIENTLITSKNLRMASYFTGRKNSLKEQHD